MISKIIPLSQFQSKKTNVQKTSAKVGLGEVFQANRSYLHEASLFLAYFNAIPNIIEELKINCKAASAMIAANYKNEITDVYYNKIYFSRKKSAEYDDVFYFMYDDLIVNFDTNRSVARFLFRSTDIKKVEAVIGEVKKFKKRNGKRKPEISLLVNTRNGIETRDLEISKPKLCISDNYNDDFKEIHGVIVKRLSKKNDKGLVLLHGKPGTGKTSYIRYLIGSLKKKVIFLPPNMAGGITDPDLISILIDNPNSVLVIEDAENIVVDREQDGGSPVSALLNISDGLLADCLNVQIICSFNTDISKIDSALMRKGRLIAKYEFKELEVNKARCLSQKLGFYTNIMEPMTLTAVYNQDQKDFHQLKRVNRIGFVA